MKYFICDRYRAFINISYAQTFYNDKKIKGTLKLYDHLSEAYKAMIEGFYDDSDYAVFSVENDVVLKREK